MKKKILIPYVYAGAGHYSVALITKETLEKKYKNKIKADLMRMEEDLDDPGLRFFYFKNWEIIMKMGKASYLGYWIGLKVPPIAFGLQHLFVKNAIPKALGYLKCYKPDLVFTTHFGCAYILDRVRKKYGYNFPLIYMNTEPFHTYSLHKIDADYIVCQGEIAKKRMLKLGIPEEKIVVVPPVYHPKFNQRLPSKKELRKKLGWRNRFTVLLASGGQGVAPLDKFAKAFVENGIDGQLVIVTGWNSELRNKIENLKLPNVIVYGFVENMHELMGASDVVAGKAGPRYVIEATVRKRPLIITQLATINEKPNLDFVLQNKIGWYAPTARKFVKLVRKLKDSPEIIREVSKRMEKFKFENGSEKLAEFLYNTLFSIRSSKGKS